MKLSSLTAVTALFLVFTGDAIANDLPARKPGLWELTITPGGNIPPTTVKQCIDAETDAKFQTNGTEMVERMGGKCSKNTMQKTSIGYQGEAICEFRGSKMIAKTFLTGDFTSQYTGEVTTKFDPPVASQVGTTMKMAGKYLGPCGTGMSPGDTILPNGQTVNVDSLTSAGSEPPPKQNNPDGSKQLNKQHHDILRQLDELKFK